MDKFNYLRGLLEESAKSCISGFSLTAANYNSAVDILKERYGKKSAVQRAHMQQLMKTERVKDERDLPSLRCLCDRVETHYRGLGSRKIRIRRLLYLTFWTAYPSQCV